MMKFENLGLIYNPEKNANKKLKTHAQSPQTVIFEKFIRVFFSTREKDLNNQFISHIAYVDFKKDFSEILNVSSNTVVKLGDLGEFDEHGIFPINPIKLNDKIYGYTTGWSRRSSVPVETSIGLVISEDEGKTFKKQSKGPILSSYKDEPFLVGDGFVKFYNNMFHMWYIYGTKWLDQTEDEPVARVYKIAYANSKDGISWSRVKKNIIKDVIGENECQALPSVIKFNNKYHMIFCYRSAIDFRNNNNKGYNLGYAYSDDLINWTRDDNVVNIPRMDWDRDMRCYPHFCKINNDLFILYNGNNFGKIGFGMAKLIEYDYL